LLANSAGCTLTREIAFWPRIIALAVPLALQVGVLWAASHSQRTEKIVKSHPALLLYDGEMDHKMMAHEMTQKERASKRREKRGFCRSRI